MTIIGIIFCTWAGLALIQLGGIEWASLKGDLTMKKRIPFVIWNTFMEIIDWTETRLKAAIFWLSIIGLILLLI